MKHGVNGTPNPDFKPDPEYVQVWDDEKRVFRRVHVSEAHKYKEVTRTVESFNVTIN